MKLLATIGQALQAETPVRGREPNTAAPADDTSGQAFDGVLAKIETKETQEPPLLPSSATEPTKPTAPTRKVAATADQGNPGAILDLLVDGAETSGKASAGKASPGLASKGLASRVGDGDGDGTVGKLLKRLKSKDGDESAGASRAASSPVIDQTLLPTVMTNPQTKARPGSGDGTVGKLLERLKSKDGDESADASRGASTPVIDQTLLPTVMTNPQTKARAGGGDGSVGKLLERPKSKDGDESADARPGANMPVIDQTFLPGVVATPQTEVKLAGDHPKAIDDRRSAELPTPVITDGAERSRSAAAPPSEGAVALDVSVSAHIAPAKQDRAHAPSPDDEHLAPAQNLDTRHMMAASDDAGSSRHDDRPSRDGTSEAALQKQVETPVATAATPIAAHTPVRGIATAVVELASQASSVAAAPETPKAVGKAPARTVILQMSPADLGTVEIRLHMSGQALDLQLRISEQRTLGLVKRERDALAKALEDHDYELNSLVIQDGSAVPPGGTHVAKHETSGDTHPEHRSGGDGPGAQAGRDGRRGQDGSQDAERQARSNPRPRSDAHPRSRGPDGRSLFI